MGFRIYKIWQILKHFAGTFRRAQTFKIGRSDTVQAGRRTVFAIPGIGILLGVFLVHTFDQTFLLQHIYAI